MTEKGKAMSAPARKEVLILGGGFGGLYAALGLERTLARKRDVRVPVPKVLGEKEHIDITMLFQATFGCRGLVEEDWHRRARSRPILANSLCNASRD